METLSDTELLIAARDNNLEVIRRPGVWSRKVLFCNVLQQALHVAVSRAHLDAIQILVDLGADVNAYADSRNKEPHVDSHTTPLLVASRKGLCEMVTKLLTLGAKPEIAGEGGTPLHSAVIYGHVRCVEPLLEHGAPVNARDERGRTPLHNAVSLPRGLETIRILLLYGARVDLRNDEGKTAEDTARGKFRLAAADEIRDRGCDTETAGKMLQLRRHLVRGDTASVEAMLPKATSFSRYVSRIPWIFIMACSGGYAELTKHLIEIGTDVNMRLIQDMENDCFHSCTGLMAAAKHGHEAIVHLLLSNGADVNFLSVIMMHMRNRPPVIAYSSDGNPEMSGTALHHASACGCITIVHQLLAAGADVNIRITANGWTPLHYAIKNRRFLVMQALLDHGADLSLRMIFQSHTVSAEEFATHLNNGTLQVLQSYVPTSQLAQVTARSNKLIYTDWSKIIDVDAVLNEDAVHGASLLLSKMLLQACLKGFAKAVMCFLARGVDVNAPSYLPDGRVNLAPPIIVATQAQKLDIVVLLLGANADVMARAPVSEFYQLSGDTALHKSARLPENESFQIAAVLISSGADVNALGDDADTPLHRVQNVDTAKLLLQHGAQVDTLNKKLFTPLCCAAQRYAGNGDRLSIIRLLLEHGARPNLRVPVITGAENSDELCATTLLNAGVYSSDAQCALLESAVRSRNLPLIRALLTHGVNVNYPCGFRGSCVLAAAVKDDKNIEIVQELLDAGADPTLLTDDELGAAKPRSLEKIRNHEAATDIGRVASRRFALSFAVKRNDVSVVREMLRSNPPASFKNLDDIFLTAIYGAFIEIADLLLQAGANINARSNDKRTALISVCHNHKQRNQLEVARFLLNHGIDVDAHDENGRTAAMYIFAEWYTTDLLLSNSYTVDAKEKDGKTALMCLAENPYSSRDPCRLLIAKGADVNASDNSGTTALHRTVYFSEIFNKDLAVLLLDSGANINKRTTRGISPLHLAARHGHLEAMRLFVGRGAVINITDDDGLTPLDEATLAGHDETARWTVDCGGKGKLQVGERLLTASTSSGVFLVEVADLQAQLRAIQAQLTASEAAARRSVELKEQTIQQLHNTVEVNARAAEMDIRASNEQISALRNGLAERQADLEVQQARSQQQREEFEIHTRLRQQVHGHREQAQQRWSALQRGLRRTLLENFIIGASLGRRVGAQRGYGVNSLVYEITHATNGRVFVLKALINPYGAQATDTIALERLFSREYDLECPSHPCILTVLHWFKDVPLGLPEWPEPVDFDPENPPRTVFVVVPRYDNNLKTVARARRDAGLISARWVLSMLCPILRAVQHLIKHNVLHMDLKLDNILVSNAPPEGLSPELEVVIADFGCFMRVTNIRAVPSDALQGNRGGNPPHQAPEFRTEREGGTVDLSRAEVWATGVMVHEMISGVSPFGDEAPPHYRLGPRHALPHADRWPRLARLVHGMLLCSPAERINAEEACLLAHALLYEAPLPDDGAAGDAVQREAAAAALEAWRYTRMRALRDGVATGHAAVVAEIEWLCEMNAEALLNAAATWLR